MILIRMEIGFHCQARNVKEREKEKERRMRELVS